MMNNKKTRFARINKTLKTVGKCALLSTIAIDMKDPSNTSEIDKIMFFSRITDIVEFCKPSILNIVVPSDLECFNSHVEKLCNNFTKVTDFVQKQTKESHTRFIVSSGSHAESENEKLEITVCTTKDHLKLSSVERTGWKSIVFIDPVLCKTVKSVDLKNITVVGKATQFRKQLFISKLNNFLKKDKQITDNVVQGHTDDVHVQCSTEAVRDAFFETKSIIPSDSPILSTSKSEPLNETCVSNSTTKSCSDVFETTDEEDDEDVTLMDDSMSMFGDNSISTDDGFIEDSFAVADVVVNNVYVENIFRIPEILEDVCIVLKKGIRKHIDKTVYKTNQSFRCVFSPKSSEDVRVMLPWNDYLKSRSKLDIFEMYLIQNVDNNTFANITPKTCSRRSKGVTSSQQSFQSAVPNEHVFGDLNKIVRSVFKTLSTFNHANVFDVMKCTTSARNGTLNIVLKRKESGFCCFCHREHSSDNAMIQIKENVVTYHCRRSKDVNYIMNLKESEDVAVTKHMCIDI